MSLTHANFAKEVLQEIHFLDAVEEPASEDSTKAQDISTRIHATLRKEKVCYWDTSDIPDEVGQQLIRYMACFVGPAFGKPVADPGMTAEQTKEMRYSELCTAARPNYLGTKLKSDFPFARNGRVFNFTTG